MYTLGFKIDNALFKFFRGIMSSFEDYNTTCCNYDNMRRAVGSDVIAGMLPVYCRKKLSELHVLDAGCGTGNYTKALLQAGLGQVSMLDASRGMLEKAREKLADEISSGRVVNIKEAKLPKFPYLDSCFDAIIFNLVLHHLQPCPDGENYPVVDEAIAEAKRVLKTDGVIVIGTCFPDTYISELWYTKLCDDITQKFKKRFPRFDQFRNILDNNDFTLLSKLIFYEPSIPDILNFLLNPLGPTRKEWRDINSYWACATEEEIQHVEKKVMDMKRDGSLESFVKENNTLDTLYSLEFIFASCIKQE